MLKINSAGQTSKTWNTGVSKLPRGEVSVAFGKKVKAIANRQYRSLQDFMKSNGLTKGESLGEGAFAEVSLINDPSGSLCVMKTKLADQKELDVDEFNAQLFAKCDEVASVYAGLVERRDGKIELITSRAAIDQNPNVYKLHSLMLEYVKGTNLEEYLGGLEEGERLSNEDVHNICFQLCHAMGEVSGKKVIHRDLKLENIMYDPESKKIKVIDFGCSTLGAPDGLIADPVNNSV